VRRNRAAGAPDGGSQILHFRGAFHGRSGYALSVTNTDPAKTDLFPKFAWPRVTAPGLRFPLDARNREVVHQLERQALAEIAAAFSAQPGEIAGILIEPIQGEGGDQHFRGEFLRALREIADEEQALLIFDEVQTGVGLTGKWWAYQHFDVVPDIVCFAKKMQVGGIFVSRRIDQVEDHVFKLPSRINSTWGGSLVDMVRATRLLEIIENERLLDNAAARGRELLDGLARLQAGYPTTLDNARGRGLMCAIDVSDTPLRDRLVRRCFELGMIVLPSGTRSVRFRPTLAVTSDAVAEGLELLERALVWCL
jgi:L-lysine 6-transaminase